MSECPICAERFTKVSRVPIECMHCSQKACSKCVKTYLTSVKDSQCMNCKALWNHEFLITTLGKSFVNGALRKARQEILFELEKSLLPITQESLRLHRFVQVCYAKKDELEKINHESRVGLKIMREIVREKGKPVLMKLNAFHPVKDEQNLFCANNTFFQRSRTCSWCELNLCVPCHSPKHKGDCDSERLKIVKEYREACSELKKKEEEHIELCEKNRAIFEAYKFELFGPNIEYFEQRPPLDFIPTKIEPTYRCPVETCRGFIKTRKIGNSGEDDVAEGRCGLCDTEICQRCHKIRDVTHQCNPDEVATVKLLKKETRSCPKCSTAIYRVEGCDHMWCTQCQTSFNWKTGEIYTRPRNNPHYLEWLRSQNKKPEEIIDEPIEFLGNCNGFYDNESIRRSLASSEEAFEIIKFLSDNQDELLELQEKVRKDRLSDPHRRNHHLRCQYLENKLTEKRFKSLIVTRERNYEFINEKIMIRQTLETVGWESLRGIFISNSRRTGTTTIVTYKAKKADIERVCKELESLRSSLISAYKKVHTIYGRKYKEF